MACFMQNSGRDIIFNLDPKRLNHISIGCELGTISFRVNGRLMSNHNTNLNIHIRQVTMTFERLGILPLYERHLSKSEIIQYFIDYHVANFTNDEVLN